MIRGKTLFLILAGALALGAGIWLGQLVNRPAEKPPLEISGIYFSEPRPVEDFALTHQSGRPFTRQDLKGKWSFLYFGYTYCPDVCPLTLSELNRVDQRLGEQGQNGETAYLFVSVDPRRDTPERLAQYAAYFNKKFQGVTGTPEELSKLAKQFGVFYQLNDRDNKENYTVDHASVVILIDPEVRLRAVFTHPDQAETLAGDFTRIRAYDQAAR